MTDRSFLILHGLSGSPEGHWQAWLAGRLRQAGERVDFPDLPECDDPCPDEWRAALDRSLGGLEGERVLIAHSLGCLLWVRRASEQAGGPLAERVLLVAPPDLDEVPAVASFGSFELRPERVRAAAAGETRLVCSDNDPYNPRGAVATFAEPLGIRADLIPGGGHLNLEAGYGPWPAVERWALTGQADFGGSAVATDAGGIAR